MSLYFGENLIGKVAVGTATSGVFQLGYSVSQQNGFQLNPNYASIKSAIQGNKNISFALSNAPAIGAVYGNGYRTNYTYNNVTFTECVTLYLEGIDGIYLITYGYSGGNLQLLSEKTYLIPTGTLSINANGTYDVSAYANASVAVSGPTYNIQTNRAYTVSAAGSTTISPASGYDAMSNVALSVPSGSLGTADWSASKNSSHFTVDVAFPSVSAGYVTAAGPYAYSLSLENKNVTPNTTTQTITPTSQAKYLNSVVVAGDANLTAENIKNSVTIFGVTGNYTGASQINVQANKAYTVPPVTAAVGSVNDGTFNATFPIASQPVSGDITTLPEDATVQALLA